MHFVLNCGPKKMKLEEKVERMMKKDVIVERD
jgi:hypothetical protein